MNDKLTIISVGIASTVVMILVFVLANVFFPASMGLDQESEPWLDIIVFFVGPLITVAVLIFYGAVSDGTTVSYSAIGLLLAGCLMTWMITAGENGDRVTALFIIYCVYAVLNIVLQLIVIIGINDEQHRRDAQYLSIIRSERSLTSENIDVDAYGDPSEIDGILARYGMVLDVKSVQMVEGSEMRSAHVGDKETYEVDDYGNKLRLVSSEPMYERMSVPVWEKKTVYTEFPTGASGLAAGAALSIRSPEGRATVYCYSRKPYMRIIVGEFQNGALIPLR